MSFSNEVKNLISVADDNENCCDISLLYGILVGAHKMDKSLSLNLENNSVYEKSIYLLEKLFNIYINTTVRTSSDGKSEHYKIVINNGYDRLHFFYEDIYSENNRINENIFVCNECKNAFFRGVFMAYGILMPPEYSYDLEISFKDMKVSEAVYTAFAGIDIIPNKNYRKNFYRLYFKDSEKIEDFLYFIGAKTAANDYMNIKIVRDVRNNVNRAMNFENANMKKISIAAVEQINAINKITEHGFWNELPTELQQIAELRTGNIELSLEELGELSEPRLSKSGVSHRMRKLIKIAENITLN